MARELYLCKTNVADFSPIALCRNLEVFDASDTLLPDLSVVKNMKLRTLNFERTGVTDISSLAGMPLEDVQFRGIKVTDISPLLKCPTLKSLLLPEDARNIASLHALPNLTRISYTSSTRNDGPDMTADQFWAANRDEAWLTTLRNAGFKPQVLNQKDGTLEVSLSNTDFHDLTLLSGAPISSLKLGHTAVTNLAPLHGMKLKKLALNETAVVDLGPLRGMPIEVLYLSNTKVVDLSPLRGMPLTTLSLRNCTRLTDLSPLSQCQTLTTLVLPSNAKNIEFLRSFSNLNDISYRGNMPGAAPQTVEEFWAEYDRQAATQPAKVQAAAQ